MPSSVVYTFGVDLGKKKISFRDAKLFFRPTNSQERKVAPFGCAPESLQPPEWVDRGQQWICSSNFGGVVVYTFEVDLRPKIGFRGLEGVKLLFRPINS